MKHAAFILTLICVACSNNNTSIIPDQPVSKGVTLKHLQWLTGTWKSVNNTEVSYEIWEKESDTSYTGRSFVISNNDTVFSEKLRLVQRGEDIFYIPSVRNQNNGQPVLFKFMEFSRGEFNFVNKDHDFPQRIIYKNPQPDFLCARIEGSRNGKWRKVDFNFLKVKN